MAQPDNANAVMWGRATAYDEVWLTTAPVNVGAVLAERFYPRYRSVILTSATLDSEDDFLWIRSRLGLTADTGVGARHLKLPSPFPLSEQLNVTVAAYLPPPGSEWYVGRLAQLIACLRKSIRMSTLVLCTSYAMIDGLKKALGRERNLPGEMLFQMPDSSAPALLSRFRQEKNALLIGTESFWEGIDLPGDSLRLLILTRLPFPVPDDPLELARAELAEARGLSPFMTVSLPAAVLKFRQAIGRVIRNRSDWGAVVITDSRMCRKNYGRLFYSAAGVPVHTSEHESTLCRDVTNWLYRFTGAK
jgi:Rad3-related DNA helicase